MNIKSVMNKSFCTNALAALVVLLGYVQPHGSELLKSTGFFALSGAITNWLAIYMLFEKVPGLYGSGVIPSRFEEFKLGIRSMMMEQFFTSENIDRFFQDQETNSLEKQFSFDSIIEKIDYDAFFMKMVLAVKSSPLGSMLAMFGGDAALDPVREPFKEKIREALIEFSQSETLQLALSDSLKSSFNSESVINKVDEIVQKRLDELSPQMVKEIIQDMIRKHLGWLVVWGGVFGGLLGMLAFYIA